jgi:hypothetical protein
MPCYDGRVGETSSAEVRELQSKVKELNHYLNGYAEMICTHCTKLDATGFDYLITGELKNWWEHHKKWDAERKAKGEK